MWTIFIIWVSSFGFCFGWWTNKRGQPPKENKKWRIWPPIPQLINNNHIDILKNPIVFETKICNLTITMEAKI